MRLTGRRLARGWQSGISIDDLRGRGEIQFLPRIAGGTRSGLTVPLGVYQPGGVSGTGIVWRAGVTRKAPENEAPIWRFLALATAKDDAAIADFARDWGPLGICRCGKPFAHSRDCRPITWAEAQQPPRGSEVPSEFGGDEIYWEPVEAWRHHSRRFCSILRLVGSLGDADPPSKRDIVQAEDFFRSIRLGQIQGASVVEAVAELSSDELRRIPDRAQLYGTQGVVSQAISSMLDEARVRPQFFWMPGAERPLLVMAHGAPSMADDEPAWRSALGLTHATSLYAELVCNLASIIQNPQSTRICSMCQIEPVVAKDERNLRWDRPAYCPGCRKKAHQIADRESKRRKRAKAAAPAS